MEMVMRPLGKANDAAVLLNVRPATVYDLARRGIIPHVRIREGTRRPLVRFDLDQIEQFVREKSSAITLESK
jgi:excisionase family DNA binding protein